MRFLLTLGAFGIEKARMTSIFHAWQIGSYGSRKLWNNLGEGKNRSLITSTQVTSSGVLLKRTLAARCFSRSLFSTHTSTGSRTECPYNSKSMDVLAAFFRNYFLLSLRLSIECGT